MSIKNKEVTKNIFYQRLSQKTQMIRDNGNTDVHFTNRLVHTREVASTCKQIVEVKNLVRLVDSERLIKSALLHDIGHTPFGHAGEEIINNLFLSIDESHYSEGFPGLFRHNINSIRLLSKSYTFGEDDYILLDSILKHSSVIPKNYNFRVFTDENILKMNYLFRETGFANSKFLENFYTEYISLDCKRRLPLVADRAFCFGCDKYGLCYFSKEINCGSNLSCYLSYRFPITIEGTVLYWADEISCFISDLRDLFKYLTYFENEVDLLIAFSKLESSVSLLQCKYPKNRLLIYLKQYASLLKENKLSNNTKIEKCLKLLETIKIYLIKSICASRVKKFRKDQIYLYMRNSGCSLLFDLNPVNNDIVKKIKEAIYNDVHNIVYIRNTNDVGKKILKYLVNLYMNDFTIFLNDSEKIGKIRNMDMLNSLGSSIYSLLSIQNRFGESKSDFAKKINKIIKSTKFKVDCASLKSFDNLSAYIKDERKDYNRIVNLFKREVGYFVASLDEKEILHILRDKSFFDDAAEVLLSKLESIKY